eukprot:Clim_evm37s151 gene=Clim_evmTU37s151
MSAQPQATLSANLHPLVLINISDHWTMSNANERNILAVRGALYGRTKGSEIEICNCFAVPFSGPSGTKNGEIDLDWFNVKQEQFKKVFPDLELIGHYVAGSFEQPFVLTQQESISKMVEQGTSSPLLALHFDTDEFQEQAAATSLGTHPDQASAGKTQVSEITELPIHVYEVQKRRATATAAGSSTGTATNTTDQGSDVLVKIKYRLVSEDSEGLAVQHLQTMRGQSYDGSTQADSKSVVAEQLQTQYNAIKALYDRITYVKSYLNAVKSGQLPANRGMLRQINGTVGNIPALDTTEFTSEVLQEYNDVLLTTYLSLMTSGCGQIDSLISHVNTIQDRTGSAGVGGSTMGGHQTSGMAPGTFMR